jgi:hypothetical protein
MINKVSNKRNLLSDQILSDVFSLSRSVSKVTGCLAVQSISNSGGGSGFSVCMTRPVMIVWSMWPLYSRYQGALFTGNKAIGV